MKTPFRHFVNLRYWTASAADLWAELDRRKTAGQGSNIITVNAEMLLYGHDNPWFADLLRQADFLVVDDTAVKWWLNLLGKKVLFLPGIDLAEKLLCERQRPALLLGNSAALAARHFQTRAQIIGHHNLPTMTATDVFVPLEILSLLKDLRPQLILVGIGHGKQERLITLARQQVDFSAIWIGVGGALDVWGGVVRRAPLLWRKLHLEWLWRLLREPRRLPRIFRAVIIFPLYALCAIIKPCAPPVE